MSALDDILNKPDDERTALESVIVAYYEDSSFAEEEARLAAKQWAELKKRVESDEDLLNKIADKLNLPAGADLEGILPLLDEKLK